MCQYIGGHKGKYQVVYNGCRVAQLFEVPARQANCQQNCHVAGYSETQALCETHQSMHVKS